MKAAYGFVALLVASAVVPKPAAANFTVSVWECDAVREKWASGRKQSETSTRLAFKMFRTQAGQLVWVHVVFPEPIYFRAYFSPLSPVGGTTTTLVRLQTKMSPTEPMLDALPTWFRQPGCLPSPLPDILPGDSCEDASFDALTGVLEWVQETKVKGYREQADTLRALCRERKP